MKKMIFILLFIPIGKSFSQNMINQTRDYIINYNKRMYIGMNNDSLLGMIDEVTKLKYTYCFFDGSILCNASFEQITTDEMISDVKFFQYRDFEYIPWSDTSKKNNHYLDVVNKVEYWLEKPKDYDIWTIYSKKIN